MDDNKDRHCSHGLHIGSYDYADGWAGSDGRLLLVEFDPQDAVSVPTDCSFQKLRVCKYTVVADLTDCKAELNKAVYEYNKPIYGSDSDSDSAQSISAKSKAQTSDSDSVQSITATKHSIIFESLPLQMALSFA